MSLFEEITSRLIYLFRFAFDCGFVAALRLKRLEVEIPDLTKEVESIKKALVECDERPDRVCCWRQVSSSGRQLDLDFVATYREELVHALFTTEHALALLMKERRLCAHVVCQYAQTAS